MTSAECRVVETVGNAMQPGTSARAIRRVRAATVCVALGVVGVWLFSLSRSVFDPMGYDQGLYQYMAERVIAGDRLYVDIWDQNGPGIVGIHWLSTWLAGTTPLAFRVFDACWQTLTIAALMALVLRSGRHWSAAWLAGGLYVLSYYSMSYVQTGQREGFAVLPLLLAVHLVMRGREELSLVLRASREDTLPAFATADLRRRARMEERRAECPPPAEEPSLALRVRNRTVWGGGTRRVLKGSVAGGLGLLVFAIKPPLALGYGALWVYMLAAGVRGERDSRRGALGAWLGLTAGFVLAAAGAVAWFAHLGWWDGFWGVLSRRDMPGYVLGPLLIRAVLPQVAMGALIAGVVALVGIGKRSDDGQRAARLAVAAFAVFVLAVTATEWTGWQQVLIGFAGVWIPAIGSVLVCAWRGRDVVWRLCLLMLLACTMSVVLQGQFFLYHLPPMLAFAACLTAIEIDGRMRSIVDAEGGQRAWLAVCGGGVLLLAVCQWWPTMTLATWRPYVLAGTTLSGHYDSITKHKVSCPKYSTTVQACERIRELTGENDPIASLFHEARIYYFAKRPCANKLIAIQEPYRHLFAGFMGAIRERRPKVLVARVPESLRSSRDISAIQAAVFDETEQFFGACGGAVRELYQFREVIGDLCLLEPK